MNELDPMMLQQAQLLGQRRAPTKAERREAERINLLIALLQVSGTALSSMLEGGEDYTDLGVTEFAQKVAKSILKYSESTQEDFDGDIAMRKIRNQLAAQLIYSDLRAGGAPSRGEADKLTKDMFAIATKLVNDAKDFAAEETKDESPTSSTLELPS